LGGKLLQTVRKVTSQGGVGDNFRLVVNNGDHAGQTVWHLHIHVLGGREFAWPPG
jgi:histidine triad (HIT) family protein